MQSFELGELLGKERLIPGGTYQKGEKNPLVLLANLFPFAPKGAVNPFAHHSLNQQNHHAF